jgi:hypothetical protein
MDIINDGWQMMIAFPPCTYLCSSGLHWNKRRPERQEQTRQAIYFVTRLMAAPIHCIAIENPIGCLSTHVIKPDQIIHPWQFGHPESKSTCLWLKNLPRLHPTKMLLKPDSGRWENQTASGQNKLPPSPDRWKIRSKTYPGIAAAMAEQWGEIMEGAKMKQKCAFCGGTLEYHDDSDDAEAPALIEWLECPVCKRKYDYFTLQLRV